MLGTSRARNRRRRCTRRLCQRVPTGRDSRTASVCRSWRELVARWEGPLAGLGRRASTDNSSAGVGPGDDCAGLDNSNGVAGVVVADLEVPVVLLVVGGSGTLPELAVLSGHDTSFEDHDVGPAREMDGDI